MILRVLSIWILTIALQGCSFKNEKSQSGIWFRAKAAPVKSGNFNRAAIYDQACLTYQGGDGIQRTAWYEIDKTETDTLSLSFKTANLLGGYPYTFSIFAVDTDNTEIVPKTLNSPCPSDLPREEGWARLGKLKTEIPQTVEGALSLEVPFDFYQPVILVPKAPTGLSGTAGNGEVALIWTAPENDGGADITDYVVSYTSNIGIGTKTKTSSSTSTTVTGLANGTTYTFTVSAKNSAGVGSASASVTKTPNSPPLPPPLITIGTHPTDQTAASGTASFSVVASVTQGASLSYQWQKQESDAITEETWIDLDGKTGSILNLTGLVASDNGDKYRVRVSAPDAESVTSNVATLTVNGVAECAGDCYQDSNAKLQGLAKGPDNSVMEYVYANGQGAGFQIWKEQGRQGRILNATGLVAKGWQKKLVKRGDGFLAEDFTAGEDIAGRVCPPNVFLNHDNMLATGRCLYYDSGNPGQALSQNPGEIGEDWLLTWDGEDSGPPGNETLGSYYEGNIKTCADKGMRLPTLYETQIASKPSSLPFGDGLNPDLIIWAGSQGVPSLTQPNAFSWLWTASAYIGDFAANGVNFYFRWSGIDLSPGLYSNAFEAPRCVLPDSSPPQHQANY